MYLDANGKLTRDSITGYRASGVPGTVAGLEYASKHFGKQPWAELVQPAIDLAAKGFPLSYAQANGLRGGGLSAFPESKRIFQRDGKFYEAGEIFVQPRSGEDAHAHRAIGRAGFLPRRDRAHAGGRYAGAQRHDHAGRSGSLQGH